MNTTQTSRLAPSPTGALHLGNARTFLINWAVARRSGWALPMRIEDLDSPRVKPSAVEEIFEILRWLSIDFDGEPIVQSRDLAPYHAALAQLAAQRLVYPCRLTRNEIEAASSAPQDGSHEAAFPRHLRPEPPFPTRIDEENANYRFVVPTTPIIVDDDFQGRSTHAPADEIGDFVVWTRRGVPAYQLAVVVDDIRHEVTDVVRGDDLLPSAARQMLLYSALGHAPPRWWHVPLVLGSDGKRLAKRHGDTRLTTYRAHGVPAERVIGLIAWWSGVTDRREELSAADFRDGFSWVRLSPDPIVFREDDHAWLTNA